MTKKANEEILERIKAKIMKIDKSIKEECLFFVPIILTDGWLGIRKSKSEGCMLEYLPTEGAHRICAHAGRAADDCCGQPGRPGVPFPASAGVRS